MPTSTVFPGQKKTVSHALVMLILFLALASKADGVKSVNHYSSADGLSDNRITVVTKDREGFVWLGSWAGINRFDGKNFISFKSNPGDSSKLRSNRIDGIVEDKSSYYLWVKAYDNQIYRFDKRTHIFTPLEELITNEFFNRTLFNKILAVYADQVWLKTANEELVVVEDAAGKYPKFRCFNKAKNDRKLQFFHLDSRGRAWISYGSALKVIERDNHCQYSQRLLSSGFATNPFRLIEEDSEGNIWLSHSSGLIEKYSFSLKRLAQINLSSALIHDIKAADNSPGLYLTNSLGELLEIDADNAISIIVSTPDHSPLFSIFQESSGSLWAESAHFGFIRWDVHQKAMEPILEKGDYQLSPWVNNFSIFEDINQQVWFCSRNNDLFFYDYSKGHVSRFSTSQGGTNMSFSKIIQDIAYHHADAIWVISDHGGVDKIVLQGNYFEQIYPFPKDKVRVENEVRGLYADKNDRIWMGTKSGKIISCKAGEKVNEQPIDNWPKIQGGIYSIIQDEYQAIWIGTKGAGIFKAVEKNGKYEIVDQYFNKASDQSRLQSDVYCLAPDKKGRIWAATYGGGLLSITEKNDSTIFKTVDDAYAHYPPGNFRRIRYLCLDHLDRLWIATTEGLVIYDPNTKQGDLAPFKIYKKEPGNIESLGGNDIQYIFRDSKNRMWLLTSSGGLNLAVGDDPGKDLKFINYSTKNGLPTDYLLSCVEDKEENLWISSQIGIFKFSPSSQTVQNYNYGGLHETVLSESSCAQLSDGKIVFGNFLGTLTFHPDSLRKTKIKANLVFTKFQVNSKDFIPGSALPDINYSDRISLNHEENVIGIEFSLLSDQTFGREQLEYRLMGFDKVWRNAEGRGKVVYSQLAPGTYTFQVRSLNGEDFLKRPFRALQFSIAPPFYQTGWAYLIYFFLLIALFHLIRRTVSTILHLRQDIILEKRLAEIKLNFFTQISHELRTPLTLILNPIEEIANHEKLSVKGKRYAASVQNNAMRMIRLVNQVLDLRKVQSGKDTLKYEVLEVNKLTKDIVSLFDDQLQRKNIRVILEASKQEIILKADPEKIEIVIYNLLANALKFSPVESTICIHLSTIDHQCRIQVQDEGPGVEETELNQIFELYFEGKNSDSSIAKGTGIGLALVKELVQLHGGTIQAKNVVHGGLKVAVTLPGADTAEALSAARAPIFLPQIEEESAEIDADVYPVLEKEKPTLLIVEDNDELRDFLSDKLEDYYQIETAPDGESGLHKALQIMPDLIISDIMMPKMDGIQLLNRVKTNSVSSHIPVILLTARHTVENHIQSLQYGADHYLPKPINIRLLLSAITNILVFRKRYFESLIGKTSPNNVTTPVKESATITEFDKQFLEKTLNVVKDHIDSVEFNIDTVAEILGMSRSSFFKKFKGLTNTSPADFVKDIRLEKAKELFDEGHQNVSEVAYQTGFGNPKYFGTCFKSRFAITPKDYIIKIRLRDKSNII